MISSPGVGSGLDVQSIISQLMSLERRPLDALESKQRLFESQLSDYGKLKSALSTFQDTMLGLSSVDKFQVHSATSGNEAAFTATADENASVGSYNIEVTSLATSHKLASTTFTDSATVVGTGTLNIDVGGNAFAVTVDGTNNTLAGIRDAINGAADNTGVSATIINEAGGSRLVLTSKDTGAANAISVSTVDADLNNTDAAGLSQLASVNLTQVSAAADASLTIDGFNVTSASNQVTGAISGVTIDLLKATDAVSGFDGSGSLSINRDMEAVKESVQGFVDAYNELKQQMDVFYNGNLAGDSTLRSIENQMRAVFNSAATGITSTYTYLSEVGIQTQRDGTLKLDTAELETALTNDFSGIASLFGDASAGVASRLDGVVDNLLNPGGLIPTRTEGLDNRIGSIRERIDQMEVRLETIQRRYTDQFASLDAMVGQMNATSSYLSTQLAGLM